MAEREKIYTETFVVKDSLRFVLNGDGEVRKSWEGPDAATVVRHIVPVPMVKEER